MGYKFEDLLPGDIFWQYDSSYKIEVISILNKDSIKVINLFLVPRRIGIWSRDERYPITLLYSVRSVHKDFSCGI